MDSAEVYVQFHMTRANIDPDELYIEVRDALSGVPAAALSVEIVGGWVNGNQMRPSARMDVK